MIYGLSRRLRAQFMGQKAPNIGALHDDFGELIAAAVTALRFESASLATTSFLK
jgi:hypothetical protein